MVISAPPATVPPVALQPASHVAASNPAPHGWTSTGPPGRHAHRHRGAVPHHGRHDRRPEPHPRPAPDRRRQRAQRAAHVGAREVVVRPVAVPARVTSCAAATRSSGIAAHYHVPLPALLKTNHLSASSAHLPRAEDRRARRRLEGRRAAPHRHHHRLQGARRRHARRHRHAPPHLGRRHRPGQQDLRPRPDLPRPGAPRARARRSRARRARCPTPSTASSTPAPSPRPPRTTAPSWPGARCPAAARPRR